MVLSREGAYEGPIETGLHLASIPESEGGWSEYFDPDKGLDMKDPVMKAYTALMLENQKREIARHCRKRTQDGRLVLDEATVAAMLGGWNDYIYPMIRASFATNAANDIVSLQPTTKRTATIVYWNWVAGTTKGSTPQGARLFDANVGKRDAGYAYSSELIDVEILGALSAPGATYSGTLRFHDGGGVRPGTVRVSLVTTGSGTVVLGDNGNGGVVQLAGTAVTISSGNMNYRTGVFTVTIAAETFTTAAPTSTYRWNSEGSDMIPQVDVQTVISTVETEPHSILLNYSLDAEQDVMAELGYALEPELIRGGAAQINCDIARIIINDLWSLCPTAIATFDLKVPTGISRKDHYNDFTITLRQAANDIAFRTQKGTGNWAVVDTGAATVVESMDGWQSANAPEDAQGLHYIGDLRGMRFYKDILLSQLPDASAIGNILVGYKGNGPEKAGYVYAPYQMMSMTPTLQKPNFMNQKGLRSRWARKVVNPDMYCRIGLLNTP
jgi:hypothetical protein